MTETFPPPIFLLLLLQGAAAVPEVQCVHLPGDVDCQPRVGEIPKDCPLQQVPAQVATGYLLNNLFIAISKYYNLV